MLYFQRSNSLEPYFKPKFATSAIVYENAIVDDDDDDDLDDLDETHLIVKTGSNPPPYKSSNVRDDFDNDTKFDFFL